MMSVCRSWNEQIRRLNGLFTDIAFDTIDYTTVSTAAKFLRIVETQSGNLRVYARCTVWVSNRARMTLLSRLRLQSWRFVCFEVEYTSASFISQFNLPAPRLLRLVHTPVLSGRLFASSFGNLRVLDASVKEFFPLPTATLLSLVTLRLKNTHPARRFCTASLLDLVAGACNLEEVQLTNFLRFSGDSKRSLVLANLKSIHLTQCNLVFLLQCLRFPNATSLRTESHGIDPTGELHILPSRGVGYFSPLEVHPIPILDRHLFTKVTAHTQDLLSDDVRLGIGLEYKEGLTVDFSIALRKEDNWEDYLHSSINELLQRIRLDPGVDLSIFHHEPFCPTNLPSTH